MYIIAVVYKYTNVCGTMLVKQLRIFIRLNHKDTDTDKDSTQGQDENSDKMSMRTRARIYK